MLITRPQGCTITLAMANGEDYNEYSKCKQQEGFRDGKSNTQFPVVIMQSCVRKCNRRNTTQSLKTAVRWAKIADASIA
eukprot:scaffold65970_cov23-Cyclotella_meneghiniana.AAC.2